MNNVNTKHVRAAFPAAIGLTGCAAIGVVSLIACYTLLSRTPIAKSPTIALLIAALLILVYCLHSGWRVIRKHPIAVSVSEHELHVVYIYGHERWSWSDVINCKIVTRNIYKELHINICNRESSLKLTSRFLGKEFDNVANAIVAKCTASI